MNYYMFLSLRCLDYLHLDYHELYGKEAYKQLKVKRRL